MIKGIVNGVEKDIVRIPMKGKNLFDLSTATNEFINSNGSITPSSAGDPYYLSDYISADNVTISVQYKETAVAEIFTVGVYDSDKRFIRRDVISNNSASYENVAYIRINYRDKNCQNVMLNLGSAPLPYEPYGYQEGWEVHKGDGTLVWGRNDTISVNSGSLPIKGYGVPLKGVEVEGNMTQESPNLVNPADNVPGYQNNDGSIHVPGSGNEMTTDFLPFTGTIYAKIKATTRGNINWVAYNSEKQALYFYGGNWSGANPSFTISPSTGYNTAYIRISWTQGATQPICVTTTQQSAFVPFEPEPDTPIWPEETGERTGNLFDYQTMAHGVDGSYLDESGNLQSSNAWAVTDFIPCNGNAFTLHKVGGGAPAICLYDSEKRYIIGKRYNTGGAATKSDITITSQTTATYIRFSWYRQNDAAQDDLTKIMLNLGSTAKPYEPYGYKVALTANSTTTPIYLGQTQTVRRVKKYEFTGNEQWNVTAGKFYLQEISHDYKRAADALTYFCSHFPVYPQTNRAANVPDNMLSLGSSSASQRVYCTYTGVSTTADFKSFLAQQYAAGTPVTIWYVLAEPQTGIVNEPIRKIGTYTDTLTVTDQDVTITPAVGNNTITVDTTLPPSKLSLTGHIKALPSV